MAGVEESFINVTVMTLLCGYSTFMLHNFRNGHFRQIITEDKFVELVAKQVDTCDEKVRGTYAACYSQDFQQTMKLVTQHFLWVMQGGDDNKVDL